MNSKITYVLGIDSAVNGCGVCVYNVQNPEQSITRIDKMSRGQAEALVPAVQKAIDEAGVSFEDIGLIATTIGPGTFTGLRVGLSAAKSFALALSVPIQGFSTLEVIAQGYFSDNPDRFEQVCVLLESKRSDYYCQIWDGSLDNPVIAPSALSSDEIIKTLAGKRTIFIGDAYDRFLKEQGNHSIFEFVSGYDQPKPYVLAKMGINGDVSKTNIEPLYLRGADVSEPKTAPRKIEV